MAFDITKLEMSPMIVKFGTAGAEVDLGATLSNVKINIKYDRAPMKADQTGSTVINTRVSGFECTVETELEQIKDYDIWKVVFPYAKLVGTTAKKIMWENKVGTDALTNALQLVLHPQSLLSTDHTGDYKFYKAIATAESSITYGPSEQARLKIVWQVFPDTSTTPFSFMEFGDPAAA